MGEFSELLRRARRGDRKAMAELYDAYRESVDRAARNGMGEGLHRQYDPVDISQSVFSDMLRELPRFEDRGEPAFRRWLLAKVHNKLCTKARRQVLSNGRRREARLSTELEIAIPGADDAPEEIVALRDDQGRLSKLLGTLDPEQRAVIGLVVDEGLPWAEVARRLRLPSPDAARMRYVRALATLKQRWTKK